MHLRNVICTYACPPYWRPILPAPCWTTGGPIHCIPTPIDYSVQPYSPSVWSTNSISLLNIHRIGPTTLNQFYTSTFYEIPYFTSGQKIPNPNPNPNPFGWYSQETFCWRSRETFIRSVMHLSNDRWRYLSLPVGIDAHRTGFALGVPYYLQSYITCMYPTTDK